MREIKNEQDALNAFGSLMTKRINEAVSQSSNNIRVGRITEVNISLRQISAEIFGTGEIVAGIKYPKGVSYGVFVNDSVLIISPDPKLRSQNFALGVY